MRKRKSRGIKSRVILYISLIIAISAMGVGYAAWNDQINMNVGIGTGYVDVEVHTDEGYVHKDNEEYLYVEVVNKELKISGEVYLDFNKELIIDIKDVGSVPVIYNEQDISNDNGIAFLEKNSKHLRSESLNLNEVRESFKLHIKPGIDFNFSIDAEDGDIANLTRQINELESKIEEYQKIDKQYKFEYKLLFEQVGSGSWHEEVKITGDIKVIHDPDVLSEMEGQLENLKVELAELEGQEVEEELEEVEEKDEVQGEQILEEIDVKEEDPVEEPMVGDEDSSSEETDERESLDDSNNE